MAANSLASSDLADALPAVLGGMPDYGLVVADSTGRVVHASSAAQRLLGAGVVDARPEEWGARLGVYAEDATTPLPPDASPLVEALRGRETDRVAQLVRNAAHPGGVWISMSGRPIRRGAGGEVVGGCVLFHDITDLRRLHEQRRQDEKLAAIGRLAGGIAHDFNNVLTAVNGFAELLLQKVPARHPVRDGLEQILKAGRRAASLTQQLLAFSRKQMLVPRVLELGHVLRDLEPMLRRLITEDIELHVASAVTGPIKIDPGQLEQVIVNLVVNARDAMPQGGRLTIETREVVLDEPYVATRPDVTPGRYVLLAISDTGVGMEPDTLARIFEPFFTTKAGRGTGLGLSTVYGIVKQSGGHVAAYSEPGRGSAFKVYLPRVTDEGAPVLAPSSGTYRLPGSALGATILLLEDDEQVRDLSRTVLEARGFRLLTATDGEQALAVARGHPGAIDLLVTDVVVPRGSGRRVFEALVAERPALRVLYMSGYAESAIVHHGVLETDMPFLAKPFTPKALLRAVATALEVEDADQ